MDTPKFFTKITILVFSILLSPFFGSVLFAQNLNEVGLKSEIGKVIFFALLWNIICLNFFSNKILNGGIIGFVISNVLGGAILAFPVWKYYFHQVENFDSRPIWGPLIVFVVIVGLLVAIAIFGK